MKTNPRSFVEAAVRKPRCLLSSLLAMAVALLAGAASGAEIAYKNGAWEWDDGSWEGGARPGPADTALIPELPILKTRFDSGRMQSELRSFLYSRTKRRPVIMINVVEV